MNRWPLALLPIFASFPAPAEAACVECSCAVETSGLSFGFYDSQRPVTTSVASVHVECQGDNGYVLKLSSGGSGTPLARRMRGGASSLDYNLYKDPGRTLIWGDGSAGQSGVSGSGTGNYDVYGSIAGGQTAMVGAYSDSLILTVEY